MTALDQTLLDATAYSLGCALIFVGAMLAFRRMHGAPLRQTGDKRRLAMLAALVVSTLLIHSLGFQAAMASMVVVLCIVAVITARQGRPLTFR